MPIDLTSEQLHRLHQAATLIDYQSIFSYYGYQFGINAGCWMIAKAIQTVAGGQLHYVKLNVDDPETNPFIHTVVKLGEDTFMDSRGLHTAEALLKQWLHFEPTRDRYLLIKPLFFFPAHLERNQAVIETIAGEIRYQLELIGVSQEGIEELSRQEPDQSDEVEAIYRLHREREYQRQRRCQMEAFEFSSDWYCSTD